MVAACAEEGSVRPVTWRQRQSLDAGGCLCPAASCGHSYSIPGRALRDDGSLLHSCGPCCGHLPLLHILKLPLDPRAGGARGGAARGLLHGSSL